MPPMKPRTKPRTGWAGTHSLEDIARRWSITDSELRRLLASQTLNFVEIRGCLRVPDEEVRQYEERQRSPV
jgi:hypothetical protein